MLANLLPAFAHVNPTLSSPNRCQALPIAHRAFFLIPVSQGAVFASATPRVGRLGCCVRSLTGTGDRPPRGQLPTTLLTRDGRGHLCILHFVAE